MGRNKVLLLDGSGCGSGSRRGLLVNLHQIGFLHFERFMLTFVVPIIELGANQLVTACHTGAAIHPFSHTSGRRLTFLKESVTETSQAVTTIIRRSQARFSRRDTKLFFAFCCKHSRWQKEKKNRQHFHLQIAQCFVKDCHNFGRTKKNNEEGLSFFWRLSPQFVSPVKR